jgi:hypothetical protein
MVAPLVERAETFELWRRLGLDAGASRRASSPTSTSPSTSSGYSANIVSLSHGDAVVVERRLYEASPAAGVTLAEMSPPRGLIVGAVVRDRRVFVPRGADRLEVGDVVILFVRKEELATVQLLFPGRDPRRDGTAGPAAGRRGEGGRLNLRPVARFLGRLVLVLAAAELLPALVALPLRRAATPGLRRLGAGHRRLRRRLTLAGRGAVARSTGARGC